ncbi:MAG: preprotein translocase subunit SecG [Candidatus Pacebacteria bacterium]|nr:preprotein translocase subunit SecG [Candidatus Paceibacterota bacterium]
MTIISTIQIILSVLLIIMILMQRSEAGIGGAIGGDLGESSVNHTRRGMEKLLFNGSIVIGVLFAATAIAALLI